jgi:hypothetical protein
MVMGGWPRGPEAAAAAAMPAIGTLVAGSDGLAWCETCNGSTQGKDTTARFRRIATMISDPESLLIAFVLFVMFLIVLAAAIEGFGGIWSHIARLLGRCFGGGSADGNLARRPVEVRWLRGVLVRLCGRRRR